MKTINDVNELNKLLRSYVISLSEVNASMVRNVLSLYGEDLDKAMSESVFDSISTAQTLILFELRSRQSSSNVSYDNEEDVTLYNSYSFKLIIYGDDSSNVANKLFARFRSAATISVLYNDGIYIESVDDPERISEFKNGTMWLRSDLSINISCEASITKIFNDYDMENAGKIVVDKGE